MYSVSEKKRFNGRGRGRSKDPGERVVGRESIADRSLEVDKKNLDQKVRPLAISFAWQRLLGRDGVRRIQKATEHLIYVHKLLRQAPFQAGAGESFQFPFPFC